MKLCSSCQVLKPVESFYKRSKSNDGLSVCCKSCMAIKYKKCRTSKKDHYRHVQSERERANRNNFQEWKKTQRCILCDETETICLDLHHLDPLDKDATLSNVVRNWSWKRLNNEISKCVVVCANCHRKIHAGLISILLQ